MERTVKTVTLGVMADLYKITGESVAEGLDFFGEK
ncbi:Hypothetical protein LUCI_4006 [Lucifera butyrica]|uniref:Uncharacterized protein n=1 Tax=Lucifera butyrica TaxID=1351585 RepID=A0A498RHZ9_9FIRM|nr:Hypothetical protein LUCI_4006 [Lucifera butyrica]